MDGTTLVDIIKESIFVILTLLVFLSYAMFRGRQALVNLIMGLYFALLISLNFPYYHLITSSGDAKSQSFMMIVVFAIFTTGSTILFGRLMPREYAETPFEGFWKKLAFALAATILVMTYSYHTLPITELVNPGSPMQWLFAAPQSFFWWLLAPLLILFIL